LTIFEKDNDFNAANDASRRSYYTAAMSRSPPVPPGREAVGRRYAISGQSVVASAVPPGLYLVATPIGNLRDITLRALEVLTAADLIACEDTRHSRKLLDRYDIATPVTPYHDHNATAARPKLIARLAQGASIALISDAGTPLISDPGYKLVREAQAMGSSITVLPGPSALLAALIVSGLATDRFLFEGFLPPKQAARSARVATLKSVSATLVLFETGTRLAAALADLAEALGPRQAAICRELTKVHEEVRRGDLSTLARHYAAQTDVRGEIVIVVARAPADEVSEHDLDAVLRAALSRLSVKEAVGEVAALTGSSRRLVYQRALALRMETENDR
jgi:16S rRNA (cytidine1402-2'-O)-methyltransferase